MTLPWPSVGRAWPATAVRNLRAPPDVDHWRGCRTRPGIGGVVLVVPYEGLSPSERVRLCLDGICDGVTAATHDLQGLTPDIIAAIEADQPARVSDAYRAFLQAVGGGAGRFLQGSDVYYPDILGVRATAQELLRAHGLRLEDTDRVFLMHHDAQFDFTRGGGADPSVWSYNDGDDAPAQTHARFTDWLRANVDEQTQAYKHLASWYDAP
jgi:hypothetical protein